MISRLKMMLEHTRLFEKFQQVEEMITTGCLLDYNYFKEHYKIMAIDLSKQQELDSDPKAVQKSKFTGIQKINQQ